MYDWSLICDLIGRAFGFVIGKQVDILLVPESLLS